MKKLYCLLLLCIPVLVSAQKKSPIKPSVRHIQAKPEQKKSATVNLEEIFEGCWTTTRNPAYYLHLEKGEKFESADYNRQTKKVEHLTGTWIMAGHSLVLNYNEMATQHLNFMLANKAWTIKRVDNAVWTKAEASKCQ